MVEGRVMRQRGAILHTEHQLPEPGGREMRISPTEPKTREGDQDV